MSARDAGLQDHRGGAELAEALAFSDRAMVIDRARATTDPPRSPRLRGDLFGGQERRATCWSSRTGSPFLKTRTVPEDWDTLMEMACVSTVIAAAAAWRAPSPSGSSTPLRSADEPAWRSPPAASTTPS